MQTVIGLFENAEKAQQAVQELFSKGFTTDNVDISLKGNNTSSDTYSSDNAVSSDAITGTTGLGTGTTYENDSLTGSSLNTMADTSADYRDRTYSKSDSSNDDSFGDKVSRFFKNLFGDDDDEVNRYSTVASKAGCVVTVYAQSEDEAERAADILDDYGAVDVDERAASYGYTGKTSDFSAGTLDYEDNDTVDKSDTLNVIKEDVTIGKREVETGGVRLRSRIVERPVEEQLRLREEKVTVQRTPVDRPATTSDFENFKEGEIELTESAEVAEVTKEARVVEEIKLSKEVNERTETVRDTARDTEVNVENLSKSDISRKSKKKGL